MARKQIQLKTPEQIIAMRKAGLVVAEALGQMVAAAKAGVTTNELDQIGREVLAANGATSNFLNYGAEWGIKPYPATLCASVNETVVHGIPNDVALKTGDIVSLDFGAIVDGWHGDAARTVIIGDGPDPANVKLLALDRITKQSMWAGIASMAERGRIGDVSKAIQTDITNDGPWGIVKEFTGHGIGTAMHMDPDVPNFASLLNRGPKIETGMCICIEPIVTAGDPATETLDDDWTVVTLDGSAAAHWENTIAVTEKGLWVLTEPDGGEKMLDSLGVPFGPLAD